MSASPGAPLPPPAPSDVVVLIPIYNNPVGLERSLRSVAAAGPYPVVVVDDGSTPPVAASTLPGTPPPIVIRSPHLGVIAARNLGVDYVMSRNEFKYVAFLDAGDKVRPERLAKQRAFLEAAPRLGIVSSWVRFFHPEDEKKSFDYRPPASASAIRRAMHVRCVLVQPAAMLRTEVFRQVGRYSTKIHCEDYELFWRILDHYEAANIPEVLTECEQNPAGLSTSQRRQQLRAKLRVQIGHWQWRPEAMLGLILTLAGLVLPYGVLAGMRQWRAFRGATYAEQG